jgi:pimeloyl-ACP methyl ester carboxylesterase
MTPRTIYREITAAGLLIASYPIDWLTQRAPRSEKIDGEPIVMSHGFGGGRANLLGLGTYLRMAGFGNLHYFEYPRWQSVSDSAVRLGELVAEVCKGTGGVHLIGHSLGGLISRVYARRTPTGVVRTLITLGSPYLYEQESPKELAVFGEEDPIVPAPMQERLSRNAFGQVVVLPATGHLGVLYHPTALTLIENALTANSRAGARLMS